MHGHSGSIGSFTLTTISALAHTSAALGTSVPPATRYASSANPEPIPAPSSTSTLCPSPTSDSTPAGTNAIRCSAVLISLGTPTIIAAPQFICAAPCAKCASELAARRLPVNGRGFAASAAGPSRGFSRELVGRRLSVLLGAEPYNGLPLRRKEFFRDAGHLFFGEPRHRRQHLIQALVRLAVDLKTGQTIHPGGRTLQGQHQLPLRLLFRLGERLSREPGAGELGVLLADRRRGLGRGLGLRPDVHAGHAHLPVEARERVDRVGQPQLFPNALEQAARHPAP